VKINEFCLLLVPLVLVDFRVISLLSVSVGCDISLIFLLLWGSCYSDSYLIISKAVFVERLELTYFPAESLEVFVKALSFRFLFPKSLSFLVFIRISLSLCIFNPSSPLSFESYQGWWHKIKINEKNNNICCCTLCHCLDPDGAPRIKEDSFRVLLLVLKILF